MFDHVLAGQTAVVTGASRGIGEAVAIGLLRSGADVTTLQRGPGSERLERTAAELGRALTHVPVDFADSASISEAMSAVGPVDILVNNAGTQIRHDAVDFPLADFERVLAINTSAVFQLSQGFGAQMVERGHGKIVALASLLSFQGGLRVPAYAASKGAVAQLVKALSNEWASHGVNVNAVAPGYVETDMNEALLADPERFRQLSERIPAGRWAAPEDIANAVVYLCTPYAAYVHGTVLPVDGGWLGR
ncbi:2-deoxy-D-gluconate 3-dehydrogenase [Leucobacter luti]|uniref:SDR family oxidoreductase n=1 Tax=Leucobacter luti TaxID=340320 RepID=UPI001052C005|nr:SDR family oxidoreductase [Leucobacter luti]MCW2289226.1 2-deoxy-D-gluconate 3-dehydrogenase [Leucobacter luti]TCK39789.1 2-deoxy-D-gluconate 3-dehydrogenase [Leucobacter luti]